MTIKYTDGDEDPDGDGLPNSDEDKYNTNPFDSDSDDDGTPDGEDPDPTPPENYFDYDGPDYDRTSYTKRNGDVVWPDGSSLGLGGSVTYTFRNVVQNQEVSAIFIVADKPPKNETFTVSGSDFNSTPLAQGKRDGVVVSEAYFIPKVYNGLTITIKDNGDDVLQKDEYGYYEDPEDLGADISFKAGKAEMTAFRPQTPHLRELEIPDGEGNNLEENPGAGIRYNGDDDNGNHIADRNETSVGNENDLIKLVLEVVPPPKVEEAEYMEYVLKRSSNDNIIMVWGEENKEGEILFTEDEKVITFTGNKKIVWVENFKEGEAFLEFYAREKSSGQETSLDKVKFFTFNSVVIAFGGMGQLPNLPRNNDHGAFVMGDTLYAQGYDVHIFAHSKWGDALEEVESAIDNRGVSEVGIFGYSWGGDATYKLSANLSRNIRYTAYIDAVNYPFWVALTARPPSTDYLINYYQTNNSPHGGLIADATEDDEQFHVTEIPWGAGLIHRTIDDDPNVRSGVIGRLISRVKPWQE